MSLYGENNEPLNQPYRLVNGKKVYLKKKYISSDSSGMGKPYNFVEPMEYKMRLRDLARMKDEE